MSEQDEIPLKGEYNCWNGGFDLPDLLLAVCSTGHTGLLRFECAEGEKTLFLRRGEVVFASSSSADDRLGEYLLRAGKITLRDFMQHTHLVQPGKRLGTLLVESGVLDPKGLVQAVIGQVRAIVLSLFRWTEAQYGFNEEDLPSKETITLDMPAARLIMDGLQRIDSWRRISQGVGEVDSVYRRVEGNENALRKLNLDSSSLEVLAILREAKNVTDICDSSPLPDIDVCRCLWAFRCLGWVELADEMPVVSAEPLAPSVESEKDSPAPDADSSPSAPPETVPAKERAGQAADPPTVKTKAVVPAPVPNEKASVAPDGSAEKEAVSHPAEDAPVSASLADLEGVELVSGDSSELARASGSTSHPDGSERYEGIPIVTPEGPEEGFSLVAPDSDTPGASSSPEPKDVSGGKESAPSVDSTLDADDADLEGLGMVLGEEKQESETG